MKVGCQFAELDWGGLLDARADTLLTESAHVSSKRMRMFSNQTNQPFINLAKLGLLKSEDGFPSRSLTFPMGIPLA